MSSIKKTSQQMPWGTMIPQKWKIQFDEIEDQIKPMSFLEKKEYFYRSYSKDTVNEELYILNK